jgi:hypothetical protein
MLKRYVFIPGIWIVALVLFNLSWAQCPEDPNDLGICDTLYVETFDCDHEYQGSEGYDSVRVAIYVTHDSNTFETHSGYWVQDSIIGMAIPLTFWDNGCADSVILPEWDNWNNTWCYPDAPRMPRSIFRDVVDEHTGDTTFNRMYALAKEDPFLVWDSIILDIEPYSSDGDSGRAFLFMAPLGSEDRRWWEGSRVLLATLTFLVYMSQGCDTTQICLDSTLYPPVSRLAFARYDARTYIPRHFLPVCDTIYIENFICGDCNGDEVTNIADIVCKINYIFLGVPLPCPPEVVDHNGDGLVNVADIVAEINYLFLGVPLGCPLLK